MAALIVQIAEDVPDAVIDHIYRRITALPAVTGAMPFSVEPVTLASAIQQFQAELTPEQRRKLNVKPPPAPSGDDDGE